MRKRDRMREKERKKERETEREGHAEKRRNNIYMRNKLSIKKIQFSRFFNIVRKWAREKL